MAAQKGREVLIKRDSGGGVFVLIGGIRQKSMSLNDQSTDVSDSESPGRWRELLTNTNIRSMSMSGSGVFKDSASEAGVLADKLAGTVTDYQFVMPGLGTFEGPFVCEQLQYQGQHEGEAQYSFSWESAGEITFT